MIGRQREIKALRDAYAAEYSEFVAVYGRRRIGKTFLVNETFNYQYAFHAAGIEDGSRTMQLAAFREALKAASSTDEAAAAMNELVGRMEYINSDLPASLPEKDRPAFHAYLFERYNSDFAPLQNELVSRVQELVN